MPAILVPLRPETRDNQFNFLRLCLASLVLLAHAPELTDGDRHREPLTRLCGTLSSGELAVTGFFLLSGFLIVQSWQRRPHLGNFLASRVLRIYPGFAVASLVSVLVAGTIGSANAHRYLAQVDLKWLLQTVVLLRSPSAPPTFVGTHHPIVNGNLWTICYEFSCYLTVGLLGAAGLLRHRRAFLGFTGAVAGIWLLPLAAVPLIKFTFYHLGVTATRQVYFCLQLGKENDVFIHLLLVFCAGGCFALYRDRIRFSPGWALAGLALLVPCMFSLVASQLALVTLGAYAFFTFAFARLPRLGVFQACADVSYGIYLYGWPVQKLLLWHWPALSPWALFGLSAVGAAAAGWVSWHFIEHPCLRFKPKRIPQPATPALATSLAPIPFAMPSAGA